MRWTGIVLVALAAVFLVSTAVQRGWIGPELQLLAATLTGVGMLAAADALSDRSRAWTTSLGVGGAVVLGVCAGAAHTWLGVVGPGVAIGLVGVAALVGWAVAVRWEQQPVAIAAGVSGLGWPIALGLLQAVPLAAAALWVTASVLVATGLGWWRRWWVMRLGLGWFGALTFLGYAAGADAVVGSPVAAVVAATIGGALWSGPGLQRWLPNQGGGVADRAIDARSVAAVPTWAWLAVGVVADLRTGVSIGLAGLAVAACSAIGAVALRRSLSTVIVLSHGLGVASTVAVALAVLIDGPVLLVALAAHAVATAVVALRFDDALLGVSAAVTGLASAALTAVGLVDALAADGVDVGAAVAHLVVLATAGACSVVAFRRDRLPVARVLFVGAVLGLLAWMAGVVLGLTADAALLALCWMAVAVVVVAFGPRDRAASAIGLFAAALAALQVTDDMRRVILAGEHTAASAVHLVAIAGAAGGVRLLGRRGERSAGDVGFVATWALGLLWLVAVLLPAPQGLAAISVAWAVPAVSAIIVGVALGLAVVRTVGLFTLGLVVAKLLTVDLAGVDVLWRVGLFLIVGGGLLWLASVLPRLGWRPRNRSGMAHAAPSAGRGTGRPTPD